MSLKHNICDVLDTEKKGYVNIGDIGKAIICVAFLIVCIYAIYNAIFILIALFAPGDLTVNAGYPNIQTYSGKMSYIGYVLGIVAAGVIGFVFLHVIAISFLWFIQIRVVRCNKGK